MLLNNKRVIVTGGSSGIAAATIQVLVQHGAAVVSFDIKDCSGETVAADAQKIGPGTALYRHCDISSRAEVTDGFAFAVAHLGGLDAMINLAAIEQIIPASDISDADLQKIMDINIRGTMLTNQAAFRAMSGAGGAIVNIASLAGVTGAPGLASYAASKGAVLGWTRSVAQEWGRFNIRVNAICPLIWTPMYERHRATMTADQLAAWDAHAANRIVLGGRYGDAGKDLAPVLVFLVSDMARFITGQTLPVDGGYLIMS